MNNSLKIQSKIKDYEVIFENDFTFFKELAAIQNKAVIIDRNVYQLYQTMFDENFSLDELFLFDATEQNKEFSTLEKLYDWVTTFKAKRNLTIVSIGGGITQDITGFIASTLYRGIKWHFVPTTFLAQTDSCIGSKTSINFKQSKNLIGTFYPPNKLYINTDFHKTLSKKDFFSGMGEVIKLQLMKEEYPKDMNKVKTLVNSLVDGSTSALNIIKDNLSIKMSYMANDEFDLGRRNLLNYGHCFGHALETASNYYVPHGIAVNIGIIFANIVAFNRNMLSEADLKKVTNDINIPNIYIDLRKQDFDYCRLLNSMKNDKKRTGAKLAIVIPDQEFKLHKFDDMTDIEFKEALSTLKFLLNI